MDFHYAVLENSLVNEEMVALTIDKREVLLIKHDGVFYAFMNRCAHLRYPLDKGTLENGELICSLHQWRYLVKTGEGINPKSASLRSYPVKLENGAVYVGLNREN